MGYLQVTAEDLESLSRDVATGSTSIQDELARLQSRVQTLVDGGWQGAASDRFHALWDEWNRSAAGLKDALDGIGSLLNQAGQQYADTEQRIAGSMGSS